MGLLRRLRLPACPPPIPRVRRRDRGEIIGDFLSATRRSRAGSVSMRLRFISSPTSGTRPQLLTGLRLRLCERLLIQHWQPGSPRELLELWT